MEDTEAKNTTTSATSPLFSFSNPNVSFGFGFGFGAAAGPPPPPPAVEESPVSAANLEPVVVDDTLSIYKGRVNTSDVFGVKNSDLVPEKYEGGLKLWESSLDLVKTLNSDIKDDRLLVEGKHVLECLHYPGGVVYMVGKKHYFGVGGGTRQFLRLVTEDGAMQSDLIAEVADGSLEGGLEILVQID